MSSKIALTPAPASPALVRRAVPVIAAATLITGCTGDPGAPGIDAGAGLFDGGIVLLDSAVDSSPSGSDDASTSVDASVDQDAGPSGPLDAG